MRISINLFWGEVSTIVDVGSSASPGSQRIESRIDMLAIGVAMSPNRPPIALDLNLGKCRYIERVKRT